MRGLKCGPDCGGDVLVVYFLVDVVMCLSGVADWYGNSWECRSRFGFSVSVVAGTYVDFFGDVEYSVPWGCISRLSGMCCRLVWGWIASVECQVWLSRLVICEWSGVMFQMEGRVTRALVCWYVWWVGLCRSDLGLGFGRVRHGLSSGLVFSDCFICI